MNEFKIDFIGVGVTKAGTTWLAQCLNEHHMISMSNPKELDFFCRKHIWTSSPTFFDEGEAWLKSKFPKSKPHQLKGEYSNSYFVDPESPILIKEYFPEVKIIISYRNPVDCIYSFYHQASKEYNIPSEFEEFLNVNPQFISNYFYYSHTIRYINHFPVKNIHFIFFDDICTKPLSVLQNLYDFLGVDSNFSPPSLEVKVNKRKSPRSLFIRNLVGDTTLFFRTNPLGKKTKNYFRSIGAHKVAHFFTNINLGKANFQPMKKETRIRLLEIYSKENEQLSQLLGRDLSNWNIP